MIAVSQRPRGLSPNRWQKDFIAMLPTIHHYASLAFRRLREDDREEAVQEAVANAYVMFWRLAKQKRTELAFATVLARFAIVQVRAGRRVGSSLNVHDVMSPYAQRKKQFAVERLEQFDPQHPNWTEAVLEDTHTAVIDQVIFRIDFPEWLSRLSLRRKRIAEMLALGHSTQEVAQQFGVSPGRISQLRRHLCHSWQTFQGELDPRQGEDANEALALKVS